MGSFNLPVAKEIPAADIFADMPKPFRAFICRGFEQLAQIDQSKIDALAGLVAEGFEVSDEGRLSEMSKRLDLPQSEMRNVGAALGMLIALVTSRDDLDELILAGGKAGALPEASVEKIKAIAQGLAKNKAALTEVVEYSSLANEVAPSFQRLDTTVELRFGFEDTKITKTVPVAICYLNTDSRNSQSFFQMKKSDVTQLIEQLKKVESQFDAIETWAKERR
jgi:hypothetical protein